MNDLRRYIDILESVSNDELQKYRDEVKYWQNEKKKYWPVSPELLTQYEDGTHTVKTSVGTLYWRNQNNQLHRDLDKPAWIDANGTLEWYQNGLCHRDRDLPAHIDANGTLGWYQNGKTHRDGDKPAVIKADGILYWCQNGQQHRFRGPAVIKSDGSQAWYWRDEKISVNSQEEFIEWMKKHKGLQRFRVNKP